MASRVNTPVNPKPEDEDEDGIPTHISGEGTPGMHTPSATNGNVSSTGGMSLEELDEKGVNEARDEQLRAALDPPSGDWVKSGNSRWNFEKRVYANDCMPDDLDPAGRTILTFDGEVESRTVGEHTYTPKLFLRISPDARFKVDKPEEIDMAHKLWLRAKDLYLSVKEERATIRKLVTMLIEDEYIIRTMKGDNSPVPVDVKRKLAQGERRYASRR